jgi:AI-2E family transporter
LPVALATAGFFVVYRLAEDYLLVPRIIGPTVKFPSIATVLAVLFGGALLGIIGALVAIPIAAALLLLIRDPLPPPGPQLNPAGAEGSRSSRSWRCVKYEQLPSERASHDTTLPVDIEQRPVEPSPCR